MDISLSLIPAMLWIFLLAPVLFAQSQPKTPYPGAPPISEVSRLRALSDHTRKLRNFQPSPDLASQTVFEAGISYCDGDHPLDDGYVIAGSSSSESKTIRMGDVQSFTVTQVTDHTIRLRLSVLPMISEQALLAEKPSYTLLVEKYGHVVDVDLPRYQSKGKACIIGKVKEYDDDRLKIVLLEDIAQGRQFGLLYDANKIWWAIPSVVADSEYPLRVGLSSFDGVIKLKDN
jgi:hypothetical protein